VPAGTISVTTFFPFGVKYFAWISSVARSAMVACSGECVKIAERYSVSRMNDLNEWWWMGGTYEYQRRLPGGLPLLGRDFDRRTLLIYPFKPHRRSEEK